MAKKKTEPVIESALDEMFEARWEQNQKKYPDEIVTGGEESRRCMCLPMPALAPRYLLQQEGFPMGRFYLLDGAQESCKSALAYEIIRWHRLQKGKGKIIEIEDKKSPDLCLSINNYDDKAFSTHFTKTMQDWNAALTFWIQEFINIMDGTKHNGKISKPGIGRIAPVCFILDSIMAAVGDDIMADVEKEGHGKRHFAGDTGLLSEFMKIFTKWLAEYPFVVVGINHLKPGQTATGIPQRHMPGGKAPGYHASVDIEMSRLSRDAQKRAHDEFIPLKLKIQKNSMAPKREIKTNMVWYIDTAHPTESGECLQRTYFDWDTASINCIFDAIAEEGAEVSKQIRELTDLHSVGSESKKLLSSGVLGISKDDPLNYHETGKVLEVKLQSDKEFRDKLYGLMGIRRRHLFKPGIDYRDQMDEAREIAKTEQVLREKIIKSNAVDQNIDPFAALDDMEKDNSPLEVG